MKRTQPGTNDTGTSNTNDANGSWKQLVDAGFAYCNAKGRPAQCETAIKSQAELEVEARESLRKYQIKGELLNRGAKMLAQTVRMLHQQNGGAPLNKSLLEEVERQVLKELFPNHTILTWEQIESDYRRMHPPYHH